MMKPSIVSLYTTLKKNNIISEIRSGTIFYDEPQFNYYTLDINKDNSLLKDIPYEMTAGGISATSEQKALLKCLVECMERYSLFTSTEKYSIYSYEELDKTALDPSLYTHTKNILSRKLFWTMGINATTSTKTFLPAQLIDLNNRKFKNEPQLSTIISTGAAGGFELESTLLRGIYEVIERDAFMTIYLNAIHAPMIQLNTLKNKKIKSIVDTYKRYKLDVYLFDITHDLGIPVFLSVLVDRTGIGPAVTIGAKANLDIKKAIIGCMEEAFMARPWIRFEMLKNKKKYHSLNPSISRLDRALLWSSTKSINKLNFLLQQNPMTYKYGKNPVIASDEKALQFVIKILKNKGFSIYYKDITASEFITSGCRIYKVIIPGLQPLYLTKQEHDTARLSDVSAFFKQKKRVTNVFPHPFL